MEDPPPLAVDIDGTLSGPDRVIDRRAMDVIQAWPAPVVVATGKAMPYPVALCEFIGIEPTVIAENGGVVVVGETNTLETAGDAEAARAVAEAYIDRGHTLGWGPLDLANRWRETEIAVSLDAPREPLDELAPAHGLVVIDTGYAYHVKDPSVDKGTGLEIAAEELGLTPADFLAVGDSINDADAFDIVGEAVAVANADEHARAAADRITDAAHAEGFLEAVAPYR